MTWVPHETVAMVKAVLVLAVEVAGWMRQFVMAGPWALNQSLIPAAVI